MSRLSGRVVVVGSTMTDMMAYCDRFPSDGETIVGLSFSQGFGGKGANQAVMAARLGAAVTFVGRVGDDEMGSRTVANLKSHGVDTRWLLATPGEVSGVAPIWIDSAGRNRIIVVPGANDCLTPDDVAGAFADVPPPAVALAQLETPQAATTAAFVAAHSGGVTTVLNPAPAAEIEAELLAMTDWLVPNETEFERLWGSAPTTATIEEAARQWGCGLVVTLGADGAVVVEGTAAVVPAWPVEVVDTTGAGDAFLGAFAAALASGLEPGVAAKLGCAAGSISVTERGTQISYPTAAGVMDVYHERSPLLAGAEPRKEQS